MWTSTIRLRGIDTLRHQSTFSTLLPLPVRNRAYRATRVARTGVDARDVLGRLPRLLSRAATGLAVLTLLLTGTLLALRSAYGDKVYPSVAVADMDLGGLTPAEARATLQSRAAALEQGTVTFSFKGKTWTPKLEELGAKIDVDGAFHEAYQLGREGNAWDRLVSTGRLAREETYVPLRISLDHVTLNRWFDQVDGELGLPPHDAFLVVQGTTVRVEPEVDGTIVDRAEASRRVQAALQGLAPIAEPLPVIPRVAKVRTADLAAAQQQVQQALSRPIKVRFEDQGWTIAPADLGKFVVQRVDPARTGVEAVSVGMDEEALASWLSDEFTDKVNREPVNATVGWNQGPVALTDSAEGMTLKPLTFARMVSDSFLGNSKPIDIPVTVTKPDVDSNNLAALGITTELARGDSSYVGSTPDRATNVETGTRLLNNTLVPPHGEFDFNRAIGEITADKGYVDAKVIAGERIDRDLGGGICSVSTTVFRAALTAGLPITEWNPHRYRLTMYEADGWSPGFDASILQPEGNPFEPGNSFKFANPTDSWMLVESWADGANVIVIIYGPELGWRAEVSEAKYGKTIPIDPPLEIVDDRLAPGTIQHAEAPEEGLVVSFTRDVYDRDNNLIESREFRTIFHSRGNVYRVSPDMQGMSPASAG